MSSVENHAFETLKSLDTERYLACLYLPETYRAAAVSIYAFDAEVARIADLVSEPMPGEIRLQWWRDQIASGSGEGAGPLAKLLQATLAKHNLPREVFSNSLDARIFDLYHDPMPDQGSFEGYIGETTAAMFQMVALCGGAERSETLADASGHAGMAFAIMRHVSRLPMDRVAGRIYFPFDLLEKCGLGRDHWLNDEPDTRHLAVLDEMFTQAEKHLTKARGAIAELPGELRNVFLSLAFVAPLIRKARKVGGKSLKVPLVLGPIQRQAALFRAVVTARI